MNNRIREFRSAQGLSQAELGKKLNVAGATVSSWEQNRTEPNMEQSIKMANYFGCTLNDLFGEPNSQQVLTQDELLFIEAYRNSDKETQSMIRRLLMYSTLLTSHQPDQEQNL